VFYNLALYNHVKAHG